jgi:hypothetical protein
MGSCKSIDEHYDTYEQLQQALKDEGLESSQLIVGIDFTKSNTWQGGYPYYQEKNLHSLLHFNPYQQVLSIICRTLSVFDDDNLIDAFGFGDAYTTDKSVFSLLDGPCQGLDGVLEAYTGIVNRVQMSGPTSFAPIIRQAVDLVKERASYHILIIIADGAVDNMDETIKAVVHASNYSLSIICVGVGRGPWGKMKLLDDCVRNRRFDNFRFVDYHKIMSESENEEVEFARQALLEIPKQYRFIKMNF